MPKPPAVTTLHRQFVVERSAVNADARTVELAFSSETTDVERWFGVEILDHSPSSVRMGRLQNGAAVLVGHSTSNHVGVVESAVIDGDRMGRAVVRFGRGAFASEVFDDIRDGIRQHISVGYIVHRMALEREGKNGQPDVYRVTDWEPYEISVVAVPADTNAGVGRSAEFDALVIAARGDATEPDAAYPAAADEARAAAPEQPTTPTVTVTAAEPQPSSGERAMPELTPNAASEILAMGRKLAAYGGERMAMDYIEQGGSDVEAFRCMLIDNIGASHASAGAVADIGMGEREARKFSMVRLVNALANPTSREAQQAAAFEFEASAAVAQQLGRDARGAFVPMDVQRVSQRDLVVGTASAGGNTVSTDLLMQDFITMLRSRMMVERMGARVLPGLVGTLAIPGQTGGATAYWVTEGNAPTETQQAFNQVPLAPKTVGAFTDISRKMLLQSSLAVEEFVRSDLTTTLALAIDLAAIHGSGAGAEPRGIVNTSGIGSVAGGANGAAPTWAHIVELWSDIAALNADIGATGFLTNSRVIGKLMTTEKSAGTGQFVASNFPDANGITGLAGARCGVSNQVSGALTKGTSVGVCSAIVFGNWADLVIGQWGALDVLVDPYTQGTSGTVRVTTLQDVDIAVRRAASFSAMLDALTA